MERGQGCWVWDVDGKRYLDGLAGLFTVQIGHGRAELGEAAAKQAATLEFFPVWTYAHPNAIELAARLANLAPGDLNRVFFASGGGESNEAAIKLARKHGHTVRGIATGDGKAPLILTAQASFHGRTLAAVTATGQPKYHQGFEPMVQGFQYFPYNDIAAFEALLSSCEAGGPRVAAVMLEPLQGEGGVHPGNPAFFQRVRELCSQKNILLIFDEVQVGVVRSGCLWGYQKLGVEPDAITLAKGLGGGFPIGALAVTSAVDHFQPGEHASTFGGNPLACRAALTVAEEISRRQLPAHVEAMGVLLQKLLSELVSRHPGQLEGVRGWGLLQGLVLRPEAPAAIELVKAAMAQGLLVVPAGPQVVRFVPPLVIQPRHLRKAVALLERALISLG
jgi:acetylornithine aminotransferase